MGPSLASDLTGTFSNVKISGETHLTAAQIRRKKESLRRRWRRTASLEANDKFEKWYDLGRHLGSGSFSEVHECICKMTQKRFAVKRIFLKNLNKKEIDSLHHEILIGSAVDHPALCSLVDIFEDNGVISIVQQLAADGDLLQRISERTFLSEHSAAAVMSTLLKGVSYLHSRGIVHRDIKPENILCLTKNDDDVLLADFGLASYVADLVQPRIGNNAACGTPQYVAPEILKGCDYSTKADIWSLGVVCFAMLGGYLPFDDDMEIKLFKRIIRANVKFHDKFWGNIGADAKDFVRCMLQPDPLIRLTAEQLLEHPWIHRYCD